MFPQKFYRVPCFIFSVFYKIILSLNENNKKKNFNSGKMLYVVIIHSKQIVILFATIRWCFFFYKKQGKLFQKLLIVPCFCILMYN